MIARLQIFTTAVVRETQSDVRRRKTGISFQRLLIGPTSVALPALLIEGQTFDVSLLCACRNSRVVDGPRRRFEVRITIRRSEVAVADQFASLFAFKADGKRRWEHILNGQRDGGGERSGRVEVNPLLMFTIF